MAGFLGRLSGRSKQQDAARTAAAASAQRSAAPAPTAEGSKRTIVPADYGMPPRSALRTDVPVVVPALDAAKAAAAAGDWRPAAELFEAVGANWELRYYCTTVLADVAAADDGWLRAWRTARPQDAAAATIAVESLVRLAWKLRSSARAEKVSAEQWEGFFRVLRTVPAACQEAAALAPEDPTPWIAMLPAAKGLQWSHEDYRRLWEEVRQRAPFHVKAHLSAMTYWQPRWSGSLELMSEFVEDSIARAPRGTLLTVMRMQFLNDEVRPADKEGRAAFWQSEQVRLAVDAALTDLAGADPWHLRITDMRSWLAYMLALSRRYPEAVEQFRLIGTAIGCYPWALNTDMAALLTTNRTNAVLGWEDAGRPPLPATNRSPLDAVPYFPYSMPAPQAPDAR